MFFCLWVCLSLVQVPVFCFCFSSWLSLLVDICHLTKNYSSHSSLDQELLNFFFFSNLKKAFFLRKRGRGEVLIDYQPPVNSSEFFVITLSQKYVSAAVLLGMWRLI